MGGCIQIWISMYVETKVVTFICKCAVKMDRDTEGLLIDVFVIPLCLRDCHCEYVCYRREIHLLSTR